MIIKTEFGMLEVNDSDILSFQEGIYGFETDLKYVLLSENEEDPIYYLQSIREDGPTFILIDPYTVFDGYQPLISESDIKALGAQNISCLRFLLIAAIKEDPKQNAVNLKSPIVINPDNKHAQQVILENDDYPIRYFFMDPDRKGV